MAESVRAEPFSVGQAVADIQRLESWQSALARRTSGITWIVWGLATTGLFMTYDFIGLLSTTVPDVMHLMPFLWIPWVAIGVLTTRLLWRSAALVSPRLGDPGQAWRIGLLMSAFILGGGLILFWLRVPVAPPGVILAVLGVAYLVQAAFGIACSGSLERGLRGWTGALFLALTAAITLAQGSGQAALITFSFAAPLATLLTLCGSGAYLASRG